MPVIRINPYHRKRAWQQEDEGRPTVTSIVIAVSVMWAGALVLAGVGFRAASGEWPAASEQWALLSMAYGFAALPMGLGATLGALGLGLVAIVPLTLLFWPLVLGLQIAAAYHRRWIYLAPLPLLLAPAAWNWTVVAVAMTSV